MADDNAHLTDKQRIRDAEGERLRHANNTQAILQEIGAMPGPDLIMGVRVDTLIEAVMGRIELDETGHYVSGDVGRLEFERDVQANLYLLVMRMKDEVAAARARSQLHIPGSPHVDVSSILKGDGGGPGMG